MSPQSMLNLPVELLRAAPAEHERSSRAERRERRVVQRLGVPALPLAVLAATLMALRH